MQRIGVFVCWCGSNIAGTVDVHKVAETLKNEAGVVFSTDYQYMCSQAGQDLVKNTIKEYNLTGVVICSCSPRMHENTFRKAAASVGLNPYMVEIANIREQCSWIHKDMATATEKAIILGRAAIAKVHLNAPLTAGESPVTKRALVIGGGIAGIQTALDIADAGYPVDIVEKESILNLLDNEYIVIACGGGGIPVVRDYENKGCYKGVAAVIFRAPCITVSKPLPLLTVNSHKCTGCKRCIKELGCPAISYSGHKAVIEPSMCYGCTICAQVCPFGAIEGGSCNE